MSEQNKPFPTSPQHSQYRPEQYGQQEYFPPPQAFYNPEMNPNNPNNPNNDDMIDLTVVWEGIRRHWHWIALSTLIAGGASFFMAQQRPNIYETSASLATTGASTKMGNLQENMVISSPLPEGVLKEAMQGPVVIKDIIKNIKQADELNAELRKTIAESLQIELQSRKLGSISLRSRLHAYSGNGMYTVSARSTTPESARILADITAIALLDWDQARASGGVQRVKEKLTSQLKSVQTELQQANITPEQRNILTQNKQDISRKITQADIQIQGATGVLELIAPAVTPIAPIAPRPLRSGALAGLLMLMLGSFLAVLHTLFDRKARSEDDLFNFELPTLGSIPKLSKRAIARQGIVHAARQGEWYEALGFLKMNILNTLSTEKSHKCLMVSSTVPSEGKSSLTATIADNLAAEGRKVLLIEADMRRGTQEKIWHRYSSERIWQQLSGQNTQDIESARSLRDALLRPQNIEVLQISQNLHILPAGPSFQDTLGLLNRHPIDPLIQECKNHYDIILIDSPPILALADALAIGKYVDHSILVVEENKTSLRDIRQSLRRARNAGVPISGFVMNKVKRRRGNSYNYNYTAITR